MSQTGIKIQLKHRKSLKTIEEKFANIYKLFLMFIQQKKNLSQVKVGRSHKVLREAFSHSSL